MSDRRGARANGREPDPPIPGELAPFFRARAAGLDFRDAFEALLRALPEARADRLMQLRKESRGAWLALLSTRSGEALLAGDSLSGAAIPLAAFGHRVTLLDPSRERLALALDAAAQQVPGRVRGVVGGANGRLPFADARFDLVVSEEPRFDLDELRRVARGELFALRDNRLGYKRSSGRTGDFHVPSPFEYALGALRPPRGERTLAGWRRAASSADFAPPRAFALYAHRRDFAQVVALDARWPRLAIGPNERRNVAKLAAHALGLFPTFAPSFAIHAKRRELMDLPTRAERWLVELAERLGEVRPALEHLIATRGNTAVLLSAVPGARDEDPCGRFALHVPMDQRHVRGLELHMDSLRRVRDQFPRVPVPEPLFVGEIDGVWMTCERRLGGVAAHQVARNAERADALLARAAEHLAELRTAPARAFDARDFERELEPRFELLFQRLPEPDTRRGLEGLRERARRELEGLALPRVLAHGDLRAKHMQLARDGSVLGYLDWGTAEGAELPGRDLLHLLVHARKQIGSEREGESWRRLLEPSALRAGERRALAIYREGLGFDERAWTALALVYPVLVGHTAESNWPHTRPGWFARGFGI